MQLWSPVIEETRAGHRSRSASPSDLAKAFPKFRGWSDAVRALDFPISPIRRWWTACCVWELLTRTSLDSSGPSHRLELTEG